MGTFVVRTGDSLESLLASCVPDLKFDSLVVEIESTDFEVNSDCGEETVREDVIGETEQKGGFTDGRVSNEKEFEKVIVVLIEAHFRIY